MTAQADGSYLCDRCGGDAGNGGVFDALVVSDLKTDDGSVVLNLHFCRSSWNDEGTRTKGCDDAILSARNMEHFLTVNPKYSRPEKGSPPPPAE